MGSTNLFLVIGQGFALGVAAGTIGSVYRCILAYEPVLTWWFRFGASYEGKWFFPAVWGCQKCISGQIALWSYVLLIILPSFRAEIGAAWQIGSLSVEMVVKGFGLLLGLILAICVAIAVAVFLCKAIQSTEK